MKKSKGISNQMDMLNGSIFDKILLFALPLAISSILQQLFNSVDVAVVGRFASSEALAAVGSNSFVKSQTTVEIVLSVEEPCSQILHISPTLHNSWYAAAGGNMHA